MFDWFGHTLRAQPETAIFLSLAAGYYFGSLAYKGFSLGPVTATLIAAVIIGQFGVTISGPLKSTFFLMFLFAIGYGVGPQFVRGIAGWNFTGGIRPPDHPVLPQRRLHHREGCRLRCRHRRGTLRRLADELGVDGSCDRRHQPPWPAA